MSDPNSYDLGGEHRLRAVVTTLSTIDPLGAAVRGAPVPAAPPVYTPRYLAELRGAVREASDSLQREPTSADCDDRLLLDEVRQTVQRMATWIEWMHDREPRGLLTFVTALAIVLQTRALGAGLRYELITSVQQTVLATVAAGGFSVAPARHHRPAGTAIVGDLRELARSVPGRECRMLWSIADHLADLLAQSRPLPADRTDRSSTPPAARSINRFVEPLRAQCHHLASLINRADRSGRGLGWCNDYVGWLPDELGRADPRFSAAGRTARTEWIRSEISRHHRNYAPEAPLPAVVVDLPILRLLTPNATSYPLDDGSSTVAVSTVTFVADRPMSVRVRAFLSMLAAHEGVPGHALHHWLGHTGANGGWHAFVHNECAAEGWAMYVERMVTRAGPEPYQVIWAYHALRRLLPATARALAISDSKHAQEWVRSLLASCPSLAAEVASPGKFGTAPDHYALGFIQWDRAVGTRGIDDVTRSTLARGRLEPRPATSLRTNAVVGNG